MEIKTAMRRPYWIPHYASPYDFPSVENALVHPDGLLAIGGDLSPERLIYAYRRGIFPWYSDEQPILWWSPSERMVLFLEDFKISRSLRKTIRKQKFTVTVDHCFEEVIKNCAAIPRAHEYGTWITNEMINAYCQLHEYGYAHSVECWENGQLVGGLYGTAVGQVFCGESMFSKVSDASKVALSHLVAQLKRWKFGFIDCQMYTDHLSSLGAIEIPRSEFQELLIHFAHSNDELGCWQFDNDLLML